MLSGVVFDLDGTLIDSRGDIVTSANHALTKHGFAALSSEEISQYVGDGAERLLCRAARISISDARVSALTASFVDYYAAHPAERTTLCRGAAKVLDGRLGLPLALCTNKPRVTTERVLFALGIERAFRCVVAGGDTARHKPDPEPLHRVAAGLGIHESELLMVGDGAQDILAGRAAGIRTVGVRGGIQAEDRLLATNPDFLIDTLDALPDLLARLRSEYQPTIA